MKKSKDISKLLYNPNSHVQTKKALEARGLPVLSTEKTELLKYKNDEMVALLLKYKELNKILTTYVEPFFENPTFPVIHAKFNQCVTTTTRLSSSEPNLQNIPAHTEIGKDIKSCFIPRQGNFFISADFSQADLRFMAHFSEDPILVEAFNNKIDLHTYAANSIPALAGDRFLAKIVNFTAGNGGSGYSLMASVLKQSNGDRSIDFEQGQAIVNGWWKRHVVLSQYRKRCVDEAKRTGGITTFIGRWIPSPFPTEDDLNQSTEAWEKREGRKGWKPTMKGLIGAWERDTFSKKIQGSTSELCKLAMVDCAKKGYTCLIQVHDSILVEVPQEKADVAAQEIKTILENVAKLKVPVEAQVTIEKSWGVGAKA